MPALVTGNVVVFKPASDTPHCATLLVELMAEAGVPPGVVNLVTGSGGEVGDAIVENPDISVISFTGSSATGKVDRHQGRPAAEAAGDGARRQERRGRAGRRGPRPGRGRDPVVGVRDDRAALHGLLAGHRPARRSSSRCSSASRRGRRSSASGPGLDEATDVGPLINAGALDKVDSYMGVGRSEGELVIGGARATARRSGQRPLLRADDLQRRAADGPHRPGGDLRAGPLGHPGRRLRRGDARAQPDPLRALVEHLHRAT